MGWVLRCVGRPENSIPLMRKAMRLDPIPHVTDFDMLGRAYFLAKAIEEFRKVVKVDPDYRDVHIALIAGLPE